MGIKMRQTWIATLDGRTRDSHIDLDGETVEVGQKFSNGCRFPADPHGKPSEVYNCFVGETSVATDSGIERSYKHLYKGELVTVETAGGVKFTCTPNHQILSVNGWIPAKAINKGDCLLVTFGGNNHGTGINPNINHCFTRFDALHKFFDKFGGKRTSCLRVDFHGDIATTEVEIITSEWFLRDNWNVRKFEEDGELTFENTDSSLLSNGTSSKHFGSVGTSALRDVCGAGKPLPLFNGGISHTNEHGFGTVANGNVVLPKYAIDNLPTETMIRSQLLNGLAGNVFVDQVICVEISVGETHVYNLQTENGYYFVNTMPKVEQMFNGISVIAKNCRCTLIAQVDGFDIDITQNRIVDEYDENLAGMSYSEWKRSHAGRR